MPKFPSIPRLSIVVPVGNNTSAFEATLISVLENRPAGCEVLVAHDGSYQDPFELADEVRFVVTDSKRLTHLVAAGAEESRGRFVHVLNTGLTATSRWADAALDQFESQQTACVAPVIRQEASGHVVAAGWYDTPKQLMQPLAAGQSSIDRRSAQSLLGSYVQASFWRRDVLRSVIAAFDAESAADASYAYGRLVIAGGWRCTLAPKCNVTTQAAIDAIDRPGYSRGQHLWAIKKAINPGSASVSWTRALTSVFKPSVLLETLGQVNGKSAVAPMQRRLQIEKVATYYEQTPVLAMPTRAQKNLRRAA